MFTTLMITPLILTTVLPSIFLCTIHFVPDDPDIQNFLKLLPKQAHSETIEQTLAQMLLNYMLPLFFLIIPIMAASIMAASSFVGEKEKHTLETLLYCPLSVKDIFRAKVLASFALSMLVSLISFLGHDAGIRNRIVLFTWETPFTGSKLAGCFAAVFSGCFSYCSDADCP